MSYFETEIFEAQEYDDNGDNKMYCLKHAMNNLFNQEVDWLDVGNFVNASEQLNKKFKERDIRDRNWGTDEAFYLVNKLRILDCKQWVGDDGAVHPPEVFRLKKLPHDIWLKSKGAMSTFFDEMFEELRQKYMGVGGIPSFIRGFIVNQNGNHWVCYRLNYTELPYKYLYKDSMKLPLVEMDEGQLKKVFFDIAIKNKKIAMGNKKLKKGTPFTPFMNIMALFLTTAPTDDDFGKSQKMFPMETFKNIKNGSNSPFKCILCQYLGHNNYHMVESHPHTGECINAFQKFLQSENN